jgi:serine acetyltransferase
VSPSSGSSESQPASPKPLRGEGGADPRITDIQREFGADRSRRQRYADLVIGQQGLWPLVHYELTMLLSAWVPGALGLFLRSKLYPLLLGHVGKNVAFGANVVLRHPHKISIGDNVWLGAHVVVADGVTIGRDAVIGAGAVVTADIPEYHVAAGVPARAMRDRRGVKE